MIALAPSPVDPAAELARHLHASATDMVLYRGNCLSLLQHLEPHSFDLVFADPPYFLSNGGFTCHGGRRAPVAKGHWDSSRGLEEDHAFTTAWLAACQRLLKPSGSIWVTGTHHIIFSVGFAMRQLGFKVLNTVTWYKPNASPNLSCRYFTHSTELLIWASPSSGPKLRHTFNYQDMKAANGGKQMRDVWLLPRVGDEELRDDGAGRLWTILPPGPAEKHHGRHPTQKPLALLERILLAATAAGDLVLDPFCGSGTTGVAARALGRRFVGIELDHDFANLAARRLTTEAHVRVL